MGTLPTFDLASSHCLGQVAARVAALRLRLVLKLAPYYRVTSSKDMRGPAAVTWAIKEVSVYILAARTLAVDVKGSSWSGSGRHRKVSFKLSYSPLVVSRSLHRSFMLSTVRPLGCSQSISNGFRRRRPSWPLSSGSMVTPFASHMFSALCRLRLRRHHLFPSPHSALHCAIAITTPHSDRSKAAI